MHVLLNLLQKNARTKKKESAEQLRRLIFELNKSVLKKTSKKQTNWADGSRGRSIDRISFFRNSFFYFKFCSFEKSDSLFFFLRIPFFRKLGQGRSG
jgi:hypothetical protein